MQDGVNWRYWKWHSAVVNDVDYLDKVLLATTVFDYRMHKQHMDYKFLFRPTYLSSRNFVTISLAVFSFVIH